MTPDVPADERAQVPASYDAEADAVYLHLQPTIGLDDVSRTVTATTRGSGVDVFFELDADGRVLGIELLRASAVLPHAVLACFPDAPDAP